MVAAFYYDVFISHAVEDKIAIANDLNKGLRLKGLHTWYSGQELRVGDSITGTIDKGIKASTCGVIIVSPHFFPSQWQKEEMSSLMKDKKKIFLVLHNVSRQELRSYDPRLADYYTLPSEMDLNEIIDQLAHKIREEVIITKGKSKLWNKWLKYLLAGIFAVSGILALLVGVNEWRTRINFEENVRMAINERVDKIGQLIEDRKYVESKIQKCLPIKSKDLCQEITGFKGTRFGFSFEDGIHDRVDHKINVKNSLGIPIDKKRLCSSFALEPVECVLALDCSNEDSIDKFFYFLESNPLEYNIGRKIEVSETSKAVMVSYRNFIRSVIIKQDYIPERGKGFTQTSIIGLFPTETYNFSKEGDIWKLVSIETPLGR